MRHDEFLQRHAAFAVKRQRVSWSAADKLPDAVRSALRFLWMTANAHVHLQAGAATMLALGNDARAEALRLMRESAETAAAALAYVIAEPDPFLLMPDGIEARRCEAEACWLEMGMSALLLELACLRLAAALPIRQDQREELEWIGEGFTLERRFALAEAGRLAALLVGGGKDLRAAAEGFRVPAERAWGDVYVLHARQVLEGCIDTAAASYAADAIRAVPQLKGPFWPLIEPHIDRHAKLFNIGRLKKLAARAAVKFLL